MDFSNREGRDVQPQTIPAATPKSPGSKKSRRDDGEWSRIGFVVMLVAVVILLIGLITMVFFSGVKSEDKYVDTSKLQAVFLNTGQVYFGNIRALNSKYFILTNIYYLQTANSNSSNGSSGAGANSNITLVKLGCELHEPYDKMIINSDQVTFWENLQDGGQVAKAVVTFEKQNPNGQKCADQSSSASTNSGNNAQSAGTNSER